MTNDKEEQTKKMISEEYGKNRTGCLTVVVIIVLSLIGIGVISCLAAL